GVQTCALPISLAQRGEADRLHQRPVAHVGDSRQRARQFGLQRVPAVEYRVEHLRGDRARPRARVVVHRRILRQRAAGRTPEERSGGSGFSRELCFLTCTGRGNEVCLRTTGSRADELMPAALAGWGGVSSGLTRTVATPSQPPPAFAGGGAGLAAEAAPIDSR